MKFKVCVTDDFIFDNHSLTYIINLTDNTASFSDGKSWVPPYSLTKNEVNIEAYDSMKKKSTFEIW